MPVTRVHTLGPIELYTDAMGAAVLIGGVTQQEIPTGTEVRSEPSSGDPYPSHQAIVSQKPAPSFTSYHIATLLDAIGVAGLKIASATNYGLRFYAQQYTEGSTPASGSVHRRYTVREGMILPRRITCSHQGDAQLEVDVLVTYDGTNDPIVITDTVAMPSGLTDAQRFTLGPITFGGVSLPQVTGIDINFGLGAVTRGSNSEIWDTHASLRTIRPSLTLRGIDIEWFKSSVIPLIGLSGTHANSAIYLRKRAVGGTFVADATAEHQKFTACGLAYIDRAFAASTNEDAEPAVMIPLRYDGTNYPIVVDTTSAIT
jgi:hypothetical protein